MTSPPNLAVESTFNWRTVCASARGTSHVESGTECHDSFALETVEANGGSVLVMACSDGAGSQVNAKLGSSTAVEAVLRAAVEKLQSGNAAFSEADLRDCFFAAHQATQVRAAEIGADSRTLACTLLLAVLAPTCTACAHLGDGFIVVREDDTFEPVFWPNNPVYANGTYFVPIAAHLEHVKTQVRLRPARDVALSTDGLQTLALRYADKTAFAPFFEPMFDLVRAAEDLDALQPALAEFLDCPAVNVRTDDDKTLMLASRV